MFHADSRLYTRRLISKWIHFIHSMATRMATQQVNSAIQASQIVLTIIRDGLKSDPLKYHKMKERLVGVSEEMMTGVKRLYQMQQNGTLLFPAIIVNDSVTKSKGCIIRGYG